MKVLQYLYTCCFILFWGCAAQAEQTPAPEPMHDLARLRQDSNPARLEVLKEILRERGIPFELQSFESVSSPQGRTQGTNLIMSFGPNGKEITVCAHHDAVESKEGGLIGGMVDNGAAVIILADLAKALKLHTLRHRVRVVLFDMEELGMLGSRAYVAKYKPEVIAAINVDIAGMGSTMANALGGAEGAVHIQNAIGLACTELKLNCLELPGLPPSDDRTFQEANLPVVSMAFIPPLEQALKIQSLMALIHTQDDNLDKIDSAALNPATQVILKTVLNLDEIMK